MRKASVWIAAAIVVALAASGSYAATTFWLTTDPAGAKMAGDTVSVAAGANVPLYCYMDAEDVGNTFEVMVGYDTSDATTYGANKDTNNGAAKRLTLVSSQGQIVSSINSFFDVFSSAGFANSQVVLDASGRESPNTALGGRPYGFVVRSAKSSNTTPGVKQLCSFTLADAMSAGQSQAVVVSNSQATNSYSSAWKYGTTLDDGSYTLTVATVAASNKPVVGANNKAVLDSLMASTAANYTWVFWGKVSNHTSTTFDIDDGSGVIIHVSAPGNTVANGNFVAVKGTLNASTKTLTASQVTKY